MKKRVKTNLCKALVLNIVASKRAGKRKQPGACPNTLKSIKPLIKYKNTRKLNICLNS